MLSLHHVHRCSFLLHPPLFLPSLSPPTSSIIPLFPYPPPPTFLMPYPSPPSPRLTFPLSPLFPLPFTTSFSSFLAPQTTTYKDSSWNFISHEVVALNLMQDEHRGQGFFFKLLLHANGAVRNHTGAQHSWPLHQYNRGEGAGNHIINNCIISFAHAHMPRGPQKHGKAKCFVTVFLLLRVTTNERTWRILTQPAVPAIPVPGSKAGVHLRPRG